MEKAFWIGKWELQETGFHQPEVNAALRKFWSGLGLSPGARVFVPLCGKSGDMIWLREQGHEVTGVELSPLGVEAFFAENCLTPEKSKQGAFDVSEADGIRILCGDFFALTAESLAGVTAVYDRAALIALPPELREKYAAHMAKILPPGARMLVVTLEYPQEEMQGPPFSVPEAEVRRLYAARAGVEVLMHEDVLEKNPRFSGRGASALHENAFRVAL